MVSKDFMSIQAIGEELGSLLVKITRVPSPRESEKASPRPLSPKEEEECHHYGYRTRLSVHIPGQMEKRASNIILVNGVRISIGDVPFALFLRLPVELLRNKKGAVPKSTLIRGGYIRADGEFQAVARLRQAFTSVLDSHRPQEFIESCEHRALRLSTHPALISYDKGGLLSHRSQKIRKLARRLP